MGTEFKDLDTTPTLTLDPFQAADKKETPAVQQRSAAGRQRFDRRRASDGRGICKADRLDEFIADPSVRSGNAEEDGGFLRIGVG